MSLFSRFVVRSDQLERFLVPSSLLYLALPYVIFFAGWLRWYWALAAIMLLAFALIEASYLVLRATEFSPTPSTSASSASPETASLTLRHLLFFSLIALAWMLLAGVGGITAQRNDWIKHESILQDLIEYSWPVVYDFYARPVPLVYYLAYYLPAAVVGKVSNWGVAQVANFVWTFLGIYLAMLWFWVLVRKSSYWVLVIFIFFSGLDIFGRAIANYLGWSTNFWRSLERWSVDFEYSAHMGMLLWVPNQAIAGWVTAGLILYAILHLRQRHITWLPIGLSVLWSPFITVGLIPYLLVDIFSDKGSLLTRARRYITWSNLCGLLLLLIVATFYVSKFYDISPSLEAEIQRGSYLAFYSANHSGSIMGGIGLLLSFWFLEVGIYIILVARYITLERPLWRWLFFATALCLTLLPLYIVGMYNDGVMRTSIPLLFCLAVLVTRTLFQNELGRVPRLALITLLVLGSATGAFEIGNQIWTLSRQVQGLPVEKLIDERGIVNVYASSPQHFLQYAGAYQSPFFQYFTQAPTWSDELDPSNLDRRQYIAFADHKILFERLQLDKEVNVKPGEEVQALSEMDVLYNSIHKNYNILLRLVAEEGGRELWKGQGWPEDRPTSIWAPSLRRFDTRTIAIPADAPTGFARVELSFVDPDTKEPLPAIEVPSGEYLGERVPVAYMHIGESESEPTFRFPQRVQLGDKIAILGMNRSPDELNAGGLTGGEPLQVDLFWQAIDAMSTDYTGFVHLLGPDGSIVAQDDHQPRHGFLPTTIWKNDTVIRDSYTLLLPQEITPGTYTLVAGMYDLATGRRLPLTQDGVNMSDSQLLAHIDAK